ncbi:hypothetical protein SY88_22880 [Clostridiales bacterium PH28_bin88]|nr:hypothetical protein SY88_22880 [Clostridiales bacterium PH28_bin88]
MMPEYIQEYFLQAAAQVNLPVEARADGLWRLHSVPAKFRATRLQAVRRYGTPRDRYLKLTFYKKHLKVPAKVW